MIAPSTADRVVYADASALAKLAVEEPESSALRKHLADRPPVYTSRLAVAEVVRAARLASGDIGVERARRVLEGCRFVELEPALLDSAAALATLRLRSLDAIHLVSALKVEPDEMIVYDRRLCEASANAGLRAVSPGA